MPSSPPLDDPGYTPSRADLAAVLELYCGNDEQQSKRAERALLRSGIPAANLALSTQSALAPAIRGRLYRLVGRVAQAARHKPLVDAVFEALGDSAPEVQRAAIVALGKFPSDLTASLPLEARLLELLPTAAGPEQRALIEALGKVGAIAATEALGRLTVNSEYEQGLLDKAKVLLARNTETLDESDEVDFDVPLGEPYTLSLSFRSGLGRIVAGQLGAQLRAEPDGLARLRLRHFRGPLATTLKARSMLAPAIELPLERGLSDEDQVARIVELLCCERITGLLERLSSAKPRLRFSVTGEGHRRALLWSLSERLQKTTTRILAHPRAALWEARLELGSEPRLFLEPRRYRDPRFNYRVTDISGASHPTIAAALAHVLGVEPNDVIWDPFVGSGLELIERGKLGAYTELIGTDVDPDALARAQQNVDGAGLPRVRLLPGDARSASPKVVTGIVTNPPLGVRHARDGHLTELLLGFLDNAKRWLAPGGRLVWLSPMPARTAEYAQKLGFIVERGGPVDVSGLTPELQVFRVPRLQQRSWRS